MEIAKNIEMIPQQSFFKDFEVKEALSMKEKSVKSSNHMNNYYIIYETKKPHKK